MALKEVFLTFDSMSKVAPGSHAGGLMDLAQLVTGGDFLYILFVSMQSSEY